MIIALLLLLLTSVGIAACSGMTNGSPLVVRGAMKPISSLRRPLASVNVRTGEAAEAGYERSDVCAVPAAGIVAEHMVAIVLAQELQRKFGGDTIDDLVDSVKRYTARIDAF